MSFLASLGFCGVCVCVCGRQSGRGGFSFLALLEERIFWSKLVLFIQSSGKKNEKEDLKLLLRE